MSAFVRSYVLITVGYTSPQCVLLFTNIDQTLVNQLHGLLNCDKGDLYCLGITTEYISRVYRIHMKHLFCNALVHVSYSGVYVQCSHTIHKQLFDLLN